MISLGCFCLKNHLLLRGGPACTTATGVRLFVVFSLSEVAVRAYSAYHISGRVFNFPVKNI